MSKGKSVIVALSMTCLNVIAFLPASAATQVYNWPQNRQPIPVCIISGKAVPGYRAELESVLKQAFDDWMIASAGKIQFVFVDKTDGGQGITCAWTNDRSRLISAVEDGETTIVPDNLGITSAKIILLTVPPKAMLVLTKNYARRVALHEIGHALGVSIHSPNPQDIMFSTIYPEDKVCALTAGDSAALLSLYQGVASSASSETTNSSVTTKAPVANQAAVSSASENTTLRSLRLNNEAAEAMNSGKFDLARTRLEEANKADPNNQVVGANLGLLYSNLASMALMMHNLPQAETYSRKSSALVEKFSTKANLISVLKTQGMILHYAGKEAEAIKLEARLKTLSEQK